MSLFRLALVLSLGVAVLPADRAEQEKLYERAASAAHWTMTFCDRNAKTCETAAALWEVFLKKAEFAGKLAYDIAQRATADGDTGLGQPTLSKASGTLTPDDLEPQWRGAAGLDGV